MPLPRLLPLCILLLMPLAATAHVTLAEPSAPAGSYYTAVFRIGHGCEGSATEQVTVQLPMGVTGAKPMPKPDWKLRIHREKLKESYQSHGRTVAESVSEISWRGGPLPDEYYDEFVIRMRLPLQPGRLYFKVTQLCEDGRLDWVQIPAEDAAQPRYPAAVLEVLPAR